MSAREWEAEYFSLWLLKLAMDSTPELGMVRVVLEEM